MKKEKSSNLFKIEKIVKDKPVIQYEGESFNNFDINNLDTDITSQEKAEDFIPENFFNWEKIQISHKITIEGVNIYFPYKPYDCQYKYMESVIKSLNIFGNLSALESPTGTGKTLCLLCSVLAWVEANKEKEVKIFYASRTHTQLENVMKELKKTPYRPKLSHLGSRNYYCINNVVRNKKGDINLNCKLARSTNEEEEKCYYFGANKKKKLKESKPKSKYPGLDIVAKKRPLSHYQVYDIEDLFQKAIDKNFCPFYSQLRLSEKANIILLPYNYLLENTYIASFGLALKDSIIIIDEAHNFDSFCEMSKSVDITQDNLKYWGKEFEDLAKRFDKENMESTGAKLRNINSLIENFIQYWEKWAVDNHKYYSTVNTEYKEFYGNQTKEDLKDCKLQCINFLEFVLMKNLKSSSNLNSSFNFSNIFNSKNSNLDAFVISDEEEDEEEVIEIKKNSKSALKTYFVSKKELHDEFNELLNKMTNQTSLFTVDSLGYLPRLINIIIEIRQMLKLKSGLSIFYELSKRLAQVLEEQSKIQHKKIMLNTKPEFCEDPDNNYYFILMNSKKQLKKGDKTVNKLLIKCVNAGLALSDLRDYKPRSVMFTSGTLTPFECLESDFKVSFDNKLINDHVIAKDQIIVGVNKELKFVYKNRDNIYHKHRLGEIIADSVKGVKGGIICYFTSYTNLYQFTNYWSENKLFSRISQTVFIDKRVGNSDKENHTADKVLKNQSLITNFTNKNTNNNNCSEIVNYLFTNTNTNINTNINTNTNVNTSSYSSNLNYDNKNAYEVDLLKLLKYPDFPKIDVKENIKDTQKSKSKAKDKVSKDKVSKETKKKNKEEIELENNDEVNSSQEDNNDDDEKPVKDKNAYTVKETELQKYMKSVREGNDSIFFSVLRGTSSEGVDFTDELSRMVIVVGIPVPNLEDYNLKLKREYLNSKSNQSISGLNIIGFGDWLEMNTVRAVNQAVGRVIRHHKDYGAVLLVDGRYSYTYYPSSFDLLNLPKWTHNSIEFDYNFEEFYNKKHEEEEKLRLENNNLLLVEKV